MKLHALIFSVLATSAVAFSQIRVDAPFQVRYAANLANGGDAVVNITNTGSSSTAVVQPGDNFTGVSPNINGSLCVNIYMFAADEQEVSCCSCLVTPNALWSTSVRTALLSNTLTGFFNNEVVIKLISTPPVVNSTTGLQGCNPGGIPVTALTRYTYGSPPATVASLVAPGLLAWGTTVHGTPTATGPNFQVAETPFLPAVLTRQELTRDVQECQFLQALGSGRFGICKGCTNVGLGAEAQ